MVVDMVVDDGLFEIGGQLKIDFQKLILGKVLIFMKIFENVFCYFRYSLNLVFWLFLQRTCYISCILKSGTTLTSIFLDKNCVNSRQCSFMTQGRY